MSPHRSLDAPLFSAGMAALLTAQFFSALADNAVLIAAIAIVKAQGLPKLIPLLQEAFVVPFILLAPFAGPLADGFPKGRVMLVANLLKFTGALGMAIGLPPLAAYGLIGIGATIYSPSKYGILSQMFSAESLVKANGLLEGSTIAAILLGVLLGGWLADHSLAHAFGGIMAAYGLAALANLFIPRLPAESQLADYRPSHLLRRFFASLSGLFADHDARFSLLGTSAFWGCGSTLRLLLFAWVPVALAINDNQTPAILMGIVSLGIVTGALIAGFWISLATVNRTLIGGVLLGPVIFALAAVHSFATAAVLLAVLGVCGGLFAVPLNALLQKRGHESIGAGNALAAQNFCENLAMLLFVGAYSAVSAANTPVATTVLGFGGVIFAAVLSIAAVRFWRQSKK